MGKRAERSAGAGCLVAAAGAVTGFGVWLYGARPGLRGGFEGERDLSLLSVELPAMVLGVPAVALAVWALASAALRGRAVTPVLLAAVALAALAYGCLAWLAADSRPPGPAAVAPAVRAARLHPVFAGGVHATTPWGCSPGLSRVGDPAVP
ncbi:hypothetical protein [Kitasatospora sp. NPDC087315]|uniref:hypothetical protein n=1 Tax=Kitasatospora sp. NPDC087315 TaxID=3364069 RepID=UPI003801A76A